MNVEDNPTRRDVLADLISASLAACYTFDGERGIAETAYQGVIKEIRHNLDRAAPLVPRWVPVGERVPERGKKYAVIQVLCDVASMDVAYYSEDGVWSKPCITHFLDGVPEVPE